VVQGTPCCTPIGTCGCSSPVLGCVE
jgi:hypothetical protein